MTNAKILVAEDEGITAKDIAETLKSQGYDVPAIALSGEEAIQKTEAIRPDLVLMDIVLKGNVDGIEAAKQIRDRFGIPVVYLTAYADEKIVERARITEPFGYIIKPFEARELRTNIEMALYKHKAEKAVRRSKQQWENTFNAMSDWVVLMDLKGRIVRTNRAGEAFTGKPLAEIVGQLCCKFVHSSDKHLTGCPLMKMLQTGQRASVELHFRNTDRWLMVTVVPVKDGKGKIVGAVHVTREITERKRTEEQIAKLAKFPAENPNPVLRISKDCTILYANRASSVVLETWGKKVGERLPQDCCNRVEEALSSGKVSTFEFVCHDGRIFKATLAPVVESGYVNVYGHDITEHKQAMEQIENLAKFPAEDPNPVLRVSGYGTVVYGNKSSEPLLKLWRCRVGGSLSGRWYDLVLDALSCGQNQKIEIQCGEQTFSLVLAPVMESNYVNIYGRDITERKQSESKIIEYQDRLRSMASELSLAEERERRHIAEGLHDDIIQPLAFLDIKLDSLKNPAREQDLTESCNQMQETIRELIRMTRAFTFDLSSPVLYELGLEAAVEEWLAANIREKYGIETVFEDDDQSKPLDDDMRALLFKAVKELLINVVKHAKASSVKVSIARDNSKINIRVEDNGTGFHPDREKDRFFNFSGYGLFSIRERLKQLGGNIEIESASGQGTRVTLAAPLKPEN